MKVLVLLVCGLLAGLLYRWRGLGSNLKKFFPRPFPQITFAAIFAWTATLPFLGDLTTAAAVFVASTVFSTLMCLTGHGSYFPRVIMDKRIKPEKLDLILDIFFGKDPRTLELGDVQSNIERYGLKTLKIRNFCGMGLKGALMTLPVALAYTNPLFFVVSFILAGLAYQISGILLKDKEDNTWIGEFLTGFFLTVALGLVFIG